ncbi:glycosyltransferase family 2 protein [Candidatus Saccharibacteria bacterium]|nr:glycosyltransferase family 2 protein [Candidatus Saccharibacteria bacterium]
MTEQKIILSVVIPAYNAEDTIVRALESVVRRNVLLPIEVIIINDGSTDNTRLVCEKYIKEHKVRNTFIKLVNQANAGHGSAINYGVANARGRYLKILDADDYFEQDGYDEYLKFLGECDNDLVCSDYKEISDRGEKRLHWYKSKKTFMSREYDKVINETLPYLLPCAAVRLKTIRKAWPKIDEKCYYDDQEFDLLIIQFCRTVSYFARPIYCYVVNNLGQSMSQENLIKNIKDHQRVVEWVVRRYYGIVLPEAKNKFVFDKILVPLCYSQYYISVQLKKSKRDFLSFDKFLKTYKELYSHDGVAGTRLRLHRFFRGLFI